MLSVIMPPPSAAQIYSAPPAPPRTPRLDHQDEQIIELVREQGPVGIWQLLNRLADAEAPGRRAEGRQLRLALWARLRRLLTLRLVYRHGRKAIGISPPPPRSAPARRARSRERTGRQTPRAAVRVPPGKQAVSTGNCQRPHLDTQPPQMTQNQLARQRDSRSGSGADDQQIQTATRHAKTTTTVWELPIPIRRNAKQVDAERLSQPPSSRTATPAQQTASSLQPDQISEAARALAKLPRRPRRRWSGWLNHRWRGYRDQPVLLPGGEPAYLFGALRGRAVVTLDRGQLLGDWPNEPLRWALVPASTIHPLLNPAARLLGGLKRGIREKKSELKITAARFNGNRPCRPGKRRGRRPSTGSIRSP